MIQKRNFVLSEKELFEYEKLWLNVKMARAFIPANASVNTVEYTEKEWLSEQIVYLNAKIKKLLEAYTLNSSVMNYRETNLWIRAYNEFSEKAAMFQAVQTFKFQPEDFGVVDQSFKVITE